MIINIKVPIVKQTTFSSTDLSHYQTNRGMYTINSKHTNLMISDLNGIHICRISSPIIKNKYFTCEMNLFYVENLGDVIKHCAKELIPVEEMVYLILLYNNCAHYWAMLALQNNGTLTLDQFCYFT